MMIDELIKWLRSAKKQGFKRVAMSRDEEGNGFALVEQVASAADKSDIVVLWPGVEHYDVEEM